MRTYDRTDAENEVIAKAQVKAFFAPRQKEPEFPSTDEERAQLQKMLMNLHQAEPRLSSDYDRSIRKSHKANKERSKSRSASGKSVPQLGEQNKQSCPPLKVFSDTEVRSSKGAVEQFDPEFVAMYGEAAAAHGISIAEYVSQLVEFPIADVAYTYRHGNPLVRPEEVKDLPTKMRRLHNWYMRASSEGKNWILLGYRNEHYGHGDGEIMIEFDELFQLYNQDAIDKAIVSAYCL